MRTWATVALLAVGGAEAGTTLVFERRGSEGRASETVVRLEGALLRVDMASEHGEHWVVWDAKSKSFTTVDTAEKTFLRIDEATVKRLQAQMAVAQAKANESLAALPPEQRAKVEKMMKAAAAGPARKHPAGKVAATGRKQRVGEYECEIYERVSDDSALELCVVPWARAPVSKADLEPFRALSEHSATMLGRIPGGETEPLTELLPTEGFPVQTVSKRAAGQTSTFTLKKVARGEVASSTFAVPPGYTEKKLPLGPSTGQ